MTRFEANCTVTVAKQGRYRLSYNSSGGFLVEIIIETADGMRLYPASHEHPKLVEMVNAVKMAKGGGQGGQFYINEYRQVIVPAGDPLEHYYAGEYENDIVLKLDDQEFSGRPHDDQGDLLKPGDDWSGRPRPGIKYTLKAGGEDIEYVRKISPGRERIVRLSKVVGAEQARQTARKIAKVRGTRGGPFYVNEFRAMFGPIKNETSWEFKFLGTLTDEDPWFPKWSPDGASPAAAPGPKPSPTSVITPFPGPNATEKTVEIADGDQGYSYELLFSDYLRHASAITVEDPYVSRPHQIANFLRFCELAVRLGSVKSIILVTGNLQDDSYARIESIKRSLAGYGVNLEIRNDSSLHDRCIKTDNGWSIHLGRGLDLYKKPEDYCSVGATDFNLRPCYKTRIVYQRNQPQQPVRAAITIKKAAATGWPDAIL